MSDLNRAHLREPRFRLWLPLLLLAACLLLTLVAIPFASRVETDLSPMRLAIAGSPDELLRRELEEEFQTTWTPAVFLIEGEPSILTPALLSALVEVGSAIRVLPGVRDVIHLGNVEIPLEVKGQIEFGQAIDGVAEPEDRLRQLASNPLVSGRLVASDGSVVAMVVELETLPGDQERRLVTEIERLIHTAKPDRLRLHVGGFPAVNAEYTELLESSQRRLLPLAVVLMGVLLAWATRSLLAVLLSFAAVAMAMTWTMAAMQVLGLPFTVLSGAVPLLLLILGVATSVHVVSGIRRTVQSGAAGSDALRKVLLGPGVAALIAALTTAVGFFSLLTARINVVREFGISAGIGAIAVAVASIALVGGGMGLVLSTHRMRQGSGRLRIVTVALRALAHTPLILRSSVVVFLLAGIGAMSVENDDSLRGEVPETHPLAEAIVLLDEKMSGAHGFLVSLESKDGGLLRPSVLTAVSDLETWLALQPAVARTSSYVTWAREMHRVFAGEAGLPSTEALTAQYFELIESADNSGEFARLASFDRTRAVIQVQTKDVGNKSQLSLQAELRSRLESHPMPAGVEAYPAGRGLVFPQAVVQTVDDLISAYVTAFAVIFLVLVVWLRSLPIALVAMVPNILPSLVALGVMGAADILLRLGTCVCFAVALGIAVDDTVHFLRHYQLGQRGTSSIRDRLASTLEAVGEPILHTSVILVAGFLIYLFSPFATWRDMGILIGVILTTALLADLFLLPALLQLVERKRGEPAPS